MFFEKGVVVAENLIRTGKSQERPHLEKRWAAMDGVQ
jgi:hypothetical protein